MKRYNIMIRGNWDFVYVYAGAKDNLLLMLKQHYKANIFGMLIFIQSKCVCVYVLLVRKILN
jgi:hypothetical protein